MRLQKIQGLNFALFFLLGTVALAQDGQSRSPQFDLRISLNAAFGTHFQRLGINLNFNYTNNALQLNTEMRCYYNFKSLGPKLRYPELVLSQGVLVGYGPKLSSSNPFVSTISNQTQYLHSVAYSYNAYFNRKKTTQQTGIFALQFDKISLITENDLLARPALDRFRTAAFLLQYQVDTIAQIAINCSMWTGKMGFKHATEQAQIKSKCYMDTSGGVYANTSHGLLSAQVKYYLGSSQNAQVNLGIDAEQVRNAVQNKFIHDMPLLPKKWHQSKNCHIPMLDENGNPYLYEENQKIRKAKPFLNAFTNANVFY